MTERIWMMLRSICQSVLSKGWISCCIPVMNPSSPFKLFPSWYQLSLGVCKTKYSETWSTYINIYLNISFAEFHLFGWQDVMYRFSEKLLAACDSVFYALISFNTTLMIAICSTNGWKWKLLCCVRKKKQVIFPFLSFIQIKILCQRQWRRDLIEMSRKSCNLVFFILSTYVSECVYL